DLADRVALDVADDRELLGALDVDREERVRVLERQHRLVAGQREVLRLAAVPVEDGGDVALAAGAARGALAEVGATGRGELDVCHVSLQISRDRELVPEGGTSAQEDGRASDRPVDHGCVWLAQARTLREQGPSPGPSDVPRRGNLPIVHAPAGSLTQRSNARP